MRLSPNDPMNDARFTPARTVLYASRQDRRFVGPRGVRNQFMHAHDSRWRFREWIALTVMSELDPAPRPGTDPSV